jgi:hypothetical protein
VVADERHPRPVRRRTAPPLILVLVGGLLSCSSGSARRAVAKPTVSPPATTATTVARLVECAGTTLHVTGTGANTGPYEWYVELRNDAAQACAIPFPSGASAINDSGLQVELNGFDQVTGPGPYIEPGGSARLVMSTAMACVRGALASRHYGSVVVEFGETALVAPGLDLVLCDRGVTAVFFGSTTAPAFERHPLNGSKPVLGWLPVSYHITSRTTTNEASGVTRQTVVASLPPESPPITVDQWASDNAQQIIQRFVDGSVRTNVRGWNGYTKDTPDGGILVWSEGEFIAVRITAPREDLMGVANGLRPSE